MFSGGELNYYTNWYAKSLAWVGVGVFCFGVTVGLLGYHLFLA